MEIGWGNTRRRSEQLRNPAQAQNLHRFTESIRLNWPRIRIPPPNFTWRQPWLTADHIVRTWTTSPLSPALDQKKEALCIPFAVFAVMSAQMKILAKKHFKAEPPKLSLRHIKEIFANLSDQKKNISDLLVEIHHDGVMSKDDFALGPDSETLMYKMDYHSGKGPVNGDAFNEWAPWAEDQIVSKGPLIGEIQTSIEYESLLFLGNGIPKPSMFGRNEGHAICLTGYGKSTTPEYADLDVWEYLNSYGKSFGRDGGYGEVKKDALSFVYGAQVRPWWVQ